MHLLNITQIRQGADEISLHRLNDVEEMQMKLTEGGTRIAPKSFSDNRYLLPPTEIRAALGTRRSLPVAAAPVQFAGTRRGCCARPLFRFCAASRKGAHGNSQCTGESAV